ncbi:MAG: CopG family antitoxin [Blastochloris sp.]|jgi:predicted DNA binding CopG/RHH family protein|nr:CopG family antitoxin [Blastochloris sp.]
MQTITNWDQIPAFKTLEEERDYWMEHQVEARIMQGACVKSDSNESTTITLRIDPRMLARLKRLAGQRYLNYQSMLKQWVAERLEKELEGRP